MPHSLIALVVDLGIIAILWPLLRALWRLGSSPFVILIRATAWVARALRGAFLALRAWLLAPRRRRLMKSLVTEVAARFDAKPCDRCNEIIFEALGLSPNGQSLGVRCSHCGWHGFWKLIASSSASVAILLRRLERCLPRGVSPVVSTQSLSRNVGERQILPRHIRQVVWRRDGGRCNQCGGTDELQFDHVIPFSRGGADTVENLQLLCGPCNRKKGAET